MVDNFTNYNSSNWIVYIYNNKRLYISSAVILSLVALNTVIINGISLFAIFKDPLKCFRNPFAVFITGILVSDFLMGLVVEPVLVALYSTYVMELDEESILKILHGFDILSTITINTSFLTVLALAVTQLCPSAFRRCVSTRTAILGLVLIWVYAIVFAVIPEMGKIDLHTYFVVNKILHEMLISIVLVIIYSIIYFMYMPTMERHQSATDTPEHFLVGSFIAIVVLIITVWPFTIAWFIIMFQSKDGEESTFFNNLIAVEVSCYIFFMKFYLDPLIFVWRLPKYRKAISIVLAPIRVKLLSIFRRRKRGIRTRCSYHRPHE